MLRENLHRNKYDQHRPASNLLLRRKVALFFTKTSLASSVLTVRPMLHLEWKPTLRVSLTWHQRVLKTSVVTLTAYKTAALRNLQETPSRFQNTNAVFSGISPALRNLNSRSVIHFTDFCLGLSNVFFRKLSLDSMSMCSTGVTLCTRFIQFIHSRWFMSFQPCPL